MKKVILPIFVGLLLTSCSISRHGNGVQILSMEVNHTTTKNSAVVSLEGTKDISNHTQAKVWSEEDSLFVGRKLKGYYRLVGVTQYGYPVFMKDREYEKFIKSGRDIHNIIY